MLYLSYYLLHLNVYVLLYLHYNFFTFSFLHFVISVLLLFTFNIFTFCYICLIIFHIHFFNFCICLIAFYIYFFYTSLYLSYYFLHLKSYPNLNEGQTNCSYECKCQLVIASYSMRVLSGAILGERIENQGLQWSCFDPGNHTEISVTIGQWYISCSMYPTWQEIKMENCSRTI